MHPMQLLLIAHLASASKLINLNGINLRVACVPSIQTPFLSARPDGNTTSYAGAEGGPGEHCAVCGRQVRSGAGWKVERDDRNAGQKRKD
ncbi:unnamed protein product [Sphagnum tenellum]